MDDDAKTLLAVLALIYGSSQGIGVFRTALDFVQKNLDNYDAARMDSHVGETTVKTRRKDLWRSLWAPRVLFYVLLVLTPTIFLALVAGMGADATLSFLGLQGATDGSTSPAGSPFYWVLLILSIFTSAELLSAYLKAWRAVVPSPKRE